MERRSSVFSGGTAEAYYASAVWYEENFDTIYAHRMLLKDSYLVDTIRALVTRRFISSDKKFIFRVISSKKHDRFFMENITNSFINSNPDSHGIMIVFENAANPLFEYSIKDQVERGYILEEYGHKIGIRLYAFISKSDHKAVIIVKVPNVLTKSYSDKMARQIQRIQAAIPGILPSMFNKMPLDAVERAMLTDLNTGDITGYIKKLKVIYGQLDMDIRETAVLEILTPILNNNIDNKIKVLEQQVDATREEINEQQTLLSNMIEQLEAKTNELFGLKFTRTEKGNLQKETAAYFSTLLNSGSVKITKYNKSNISLLISSTLTYYDKDAVRTIINSNKYPENVKDFLRECFINEKYKIHVIGKFKTDLCTYLQPEKGDNEEVDGESIWNPHINRYKCMGNYTSEITSSLVKGDAVGAIQLAIASVSSLNFYDTVVLDYFIAVCMNGSYNDVFIETANGEYITPAEVCGRCVVERSNEI